MKLQHRVGLLFVLFGFSMLRSTWPEIIAMGVMVFVMGIILFLAEAN